MGMDSAVRKLVKEMREIVAEEVRAQVRPHIQVPPPSAPLSVVAPERTEQDCSVGTHVDERTSREHLVPHAPADPAQPIFDAAEAAWFLRYSTMKAFYQAVHRYGIAHARRGARVMLFRRADLEKFIASRTRGH